MRLFVFFIFLSNFVLGQHEMTKEVTKEEFHNCNDSWILMKEGPISIWYFRIKEKNDSVFVFKDVMIFEKNNTKRLYKNFYNDLFPLIKDDEYTLRFLDFLILHTRWEILLRNNRPEIAEKVIGFYNLDIETKKKRFR